MSDYTPTTEEVREDFAFPWSPEQIGDRPARVAAFDRWLSERDAEVRAAALAEQGETEWEYGFTSNWGTFAAHDRISAEQQASTIRTEIEAGRSSGDLKYHGRVMKRTTVKAGPWMPVPDTTGAES